VHISLQIEAMTAAHLLTSTNWLVSYLGNDVWGLLPLICWSHLWNPSSLLSTYITDEATSVSRASRVNCIQLGNIRRVAGAIKHHCSFYRLLTCMQVNIPSWHCCTVLHGIQSSAVPFCGLCRAMTECAQDIVMDNYRANGQSVMLAVSS